MRTFGEFVESNNLSKSDVKFWQAKAKTYTNFETGEDTGVKLRYLTLSKKAEGYDLIALSRNAANAVIDKTIKVRDLEVTEYNDKLYLIMPAQREAWDDVDW